ncbi:hypothetical protein DMN91_004158 [Ooceraea biroi]|uniref:DUF4806 domain-containing protein n=1 Tax=Ooceraea biroi TaxID=2015173 RepID=A0A026VYD1_OOCBI|nr:uncharacterized protein LOC105285521 [Ooceraea biroi]EZA48471.1 hypothetical protein X777_13793 [Ooceraea biroi]RLU23950.1 hypothetical protein DMN91_004158 [Ooceraea biroi]
MESLKQNQLMENEKKSKKTFTVSSSGRIIKPPKHILPTSSDEALIRRKKSSKNMISMKKELERLRSIYGKADKVTKVVSRNPISSVEKENVASNASPHDILPIRYCSDTIESSSKKPTYSVEPTKQPSVHHILESVPLSNIVLPAEESSITMKHMKSVSFNEDSLHYCKQILDKLKIIESQNKEILLDNGKIMKELLRMNMGEEALNKSLLKPLDGFPLHTMDQFTEMGTDSKKEERKKLFYHLCNLGGSKLREFLSGSLKQAMTDELVNHFTWSGDKKSEKFGDTTIANILYLAAKKCPFFDGPNTISQFKIEMQEVLRSTKQRFRNSLTKMSKSDRDTDGDDVELMEEM